MNKELIEIITNIRKHPTSLICDKIIMYSCVHTSCINCPVNKDTEAYKQIYPIHYGDTIIQIGNI